MSQPRQEGIFARVRAWSDLAGQVAAGALILALLVAVLLGVATRTLGDPLIWTDEGSRFLMVWLAVVGWWLASRRRAHIRIRFFVDLMPPSARRLAELAIQAAVAVFGALTAWHGASLVLRNYDVTATTLPISMAALYVPVVLAGLVTALQATGEVFEAASGADPAGPRSQGSIE